MLLNIPAKLSGALHCIAMPLIILIDAIVECKKFLLLHKTILAY